MHLLTLIFGILGVLSMAYGLMVLGTASGTSFWMVWEGAGLLALVLAILFLTGYWAKIPALVRTLSISLALAGLACVLFCSFLMVSHFEDRPGEAPDCLIVLGAQIRTDGPSLSLRYRLDAAADCLREYPETLCILSGGKGPNEPLSEAEGMKRYLTELGISEDRLILEDRSRNTIENIRFSKALLPEGCRSVCIVTNNFHLYRGLALAKKQGLTGLSGIAAPSARSFLPNNMLRECFGIAKDCLQGNMDLF